jgi:hypothetical protein
LFLQAASAAIRSSDPGFVDLRARFESEHGVDLLGDGDPTDARLERSLEDRTLRRSYIDMMLAHLGSTETHACLTRAARERVSSMVNAWRNAPIQGGVADIMLVAYADLHERLRSHPSARPVQTVHDSVVIECDRVDAERVAAAVRLALESASLRFCPDVRPRADIDIRTSLADADALPRVAMQVG